jgi:hypothetical protein
VSKFEFDTGAATRRAIELHLSGMSIMGALGVAADEMTRSKITMSELIEVHPLEVRGQKIRVWLDGLGMFRATLDSGNDYIQAATREGLSGKLSAALREASVQVQVRFSKMASGGRLTRGIATGIHAGNGNVLVTWADGSKGQLDKYQGSRAIMDDMDDADALDAERLSHAVAAASRAYASFAQKHEFDLHKAVADAIAEAAK